MKGKLGSSSVLKYLKIAIYFVLGTYIFTALNAEFHTQKNYWFFF
jgi:hypothetical protein